MTRHPRPDAPQHESFLRRWSSRKQADHQPATSPESTSHPEDHGESVPLNAIIPDGRSGRMQTTVEADRLDLAQPEGPVEKPVLTDTDMPSLDRLDEHSDYSGFLSPGVSDALRKRALRKLFTATVFNVRDGLDDYDEDFTSFEPLGDWVTSDMKHQAEVQEKRRREAEEKVSRRVAEEHEKDEPSASDHSSTAEIEETDQVTESDSGPVGEPDRSAPREQDVATPHSHDKASVPG